MADDILPTPQPGVIASNPTGVAVAATAFIANASALAGLVLSWSAGLTTAVTVTATSAVALAGALYATARSSSKAQLSALQHAVDVGRAVVADGKIIHPLTLPAPTPPNPGA